MLLCSTRNSLPSSLPEQAAPRTAFGAIRLSKLLEGGGEQVDRTCDESEGERTQYSFHLAPVARLLKGGPRLKRSLVVHAGQSRLPPRRHDVEHDVLSKVYTHVRKRARTTAPLFRPARANMIPLGSPDTHGHTRARITTRCRALNPTVNTAPRVSNLLRLSKQFAVSFVRAAAAAARPLSPPLRQTCIILLEQCRPHFSR